MYEIWSPKSRDGDTTLPSLLLVRENILVSFDGFPKDYELSERFKREAARHLKIRNERKRHRHELRSPKVNEGRSMGSMEVIYPNVVIHVKVRPEHLPARIRSRLERRVDANRARKQKNQ